MVLESVKLKAYQDSGEIWTIGVGHTKGVFEGQSITMTQAESLLKEDLAPLFSVMIKYPTLSATKITGYVSFGFNCGIGALGKVLAGTDRIDNPKHTRDAKGIVLSGLLVRRNLEIALIAF